MKRIYLSLLIIFATAISVIGIAYAYFTSNTVKITGISFATGNPSMLISNDAVNWSTSVTGYQETGMYPGYVGNPHDFWIRDSGSIKIVTIIPTITGTPSGDWDILKTGIEAQFKDFNNGLLSDWKSLADWQTNASIALTMAPNIPSGNNHFQIIYRMPTGGPDTSGMQGKAIDGIEWSFVGRTE